MALGLQVLHARDIIHRDLKPGNILLVENTVDEWARACGGLQIKLCDFGTARRMTASSFLATKSVAGTLAFLPPEALKDFGIMSAEGGPTEVIFSFASDVFSLGSIPLFVSLPLRLFCSAFDLNMIDDGVI